MKKETNCGLHEVLNVPVYVELLTFLQPKPLGGNEGTHGSIPTLW